VNTLHTGNDDDDDDDDERNRYHQDSPILYFSNTMGLFSSYTEVLSAAHSAY
jgi:hypothetical protein